MPQGGTSLRATNATAAVQLFPKKPAYQHRGVEFPARTHALYALDYARIL